MKILNINLYDKVGGAAIAAYRHNEAMNQCGFDSKLLVINRTDLNNSHIVVPSLNPLYLRIKAWLNKGLSYRLVKHYHPYASWSYGAYGFDLSKEAAVQEADLLILHWINEGMLSLSGIKKLLELGKPTYWFMHDMWPLTGGCHYSLSCNRYSNQCGCCPLFNNKTGSSKENDLSFKQLSRKLKLWSGYANLKILTPSQWLFNCAHKSKLFSASQIKLCRNIINTDLYKQIDKNYARSLLNLPTNKKLILFGADSINSPYKGWESLKKSLSSFHEAIECVVFGNVNKEIIQEELPVKVHFMGKLNDDYSLISLYNACDVFVTPSIADNYPNVLIEAMACGLPCVGYKVGGIPEIIDHEKNGYIAYHMTSENLAEGIRWILTNSHYTELAYQARAKIINQSSFESAINNNIYHKLFLNEN